MKLKTNLMQTMTLGGAQRLRPLACALVACLAVAAPGCDGGGSDEETASATDGDTDDTPPGPECDPLAANVEVGELLNAPVEADVEIITKVPTHPGDPGPLNLP